MTIRQRNVHAFTNKNFYQAGGSWLWVLASLGLTTSVLAEEDVATSEKTAIVPLERIVVVGEPMSVPGEVSAELSQVRQPLPAHDGADYLKGMTGFSLIRKGGASGDPVFRGMAGSRLTVLTDGETLLGGCSSRMDPPTAYISPQAYDRVVVVKGPHNVIDGPGGSAATVRFERDQERLDEPTRSGHYQLTGARFGRLDSQFEATLGQPAGFFRVHAGYARSDDYQSGDGTDIHSAYERWNTQLTGGWTPTDDRLVSISIGTSDGEAAYADRGMDGTRFRRENVGFRWREENLSTVWTKLELQAFYNYTDHVMDNFSLREFQPMGMMADPTASNPDRRTRGLRLRTVLEFHPDWQLTTGLDGQQNEHRDRRSMNQNEQAYQDLPRKPDADSRQAGVFGELQWSVSFDQRLHAGLRLDAWRALDLREQLGSMHASSANPTAGMRRSDQLVSGFVRYEHDTTAGTWYLGPGYVERFPDYWELIGNDRAGNSSESAFGTRPERTLQWDAGWLWQQGPWQQSVNVFYGDIDDFILIDASERQSAEVSVRNVAARTAGIEWDAQYRWSERWETELSLAYTRGRNRTDDQPLAQQPPLELRLGQQLQVGTARYGVLWRLVQGQHRVAPDQGNIAGLDLGTTAGFGSLAVNGRWQLGQAFTISAGVDNLLDRQYVEHLSKSGGMVAGYLPHQQIPEPGRTWWANLAYKF